MYKDGILVINKPADWTSQDVCSKLKGRLHIKKIGHTGTLDPMATGVLPICIGKATRIIEYYDKDHKTYHATMQLGQVTDTLDSTGEILETRDFSRVTEAMLREKFAKFLGKISQIPPKYSAIQIDGRRAYDLAREGKEVEIKAREIEIYRNEPTFIDLDKGIVEFDVECSKGTYIRTICDDIGRELGCGACMTALVRTANGCFDLNNALELSDVIAMSDEEINSHIITMEDTLVVPGTIILNDNRSIPFCNGHPSSDRCFRIKDYSAYEAVLNYDVDGRTASKLTGGYIYKVFSYSGSFLGMGEYINSELIPRKVIYER